MSNLDHYFLCRDTLGQLVRVQPLTESQAEALTPAAYGGKTVPLGISLNELASGRARVGGPPKGFSQPKSSSGIPRLDPNMDLYPFRWRGSNNRPGIYQRMRTDPIAQALEKHLKLQGKAAGWSAQTSGTRDDAAALRMAAFVEHVILKELGPSWEDVLNRLLGATLVGFEVLEIVFQPREIYVERDGAVIWDGPALIPHLYARPPRTVQAWLPREGERWAMQQCSGPTGKRPPPIEPYEMVYYGYEAYGESVEGRGLLRGAYSPAAARMNFRELELHGLSRGAYGIPYVKVMNSARSLYQTDAEWAAVNCEVDEILQHMMARPHEFVKLPEGFSLSMVQVPTDMQSIDRAMRARGYEMAQAVLAPWLFTGDGNGTEALHRSQVELSGEQTQSILGDIGAVLSRGPESLVQQIVALNVGEDALTDAPVWVPGEVRTQSVRSMVESVVAAAQAGLMVPGPQDGVWVRRGMGLPPQGDAQREVWDARTDRELEGPAQPVPGGLTKKQIGQARMLLTDLEDGSQSPATTALLLSLALGCSLEEARALVDGVAVTQHQHDHQHDHEGGGCALRSKQHPARSLLPSEYMIRLEEHNGRKDTDTELQVSMVKAWRDRNAEAHAQNVVAAGSLDKARRVRAPSSQDLQRELVVHLRSSYLRARRTVALEMDRQVAREAPELQDSPAQAEEMAPREGPLTARELAALLQQAGAVGTLVPIGVVAGNGWRSTPGVWVSYRDRDDAPQTWEASGYGLTPATVERAQSLLREAVRNGEPLPVPSPERLGVARQSGPELPPGGRPAGSGTRVEIQALEDWIAAQAAQALPAPRRDPEAPDFPADGVRPEQMIRGIAGSTADGAKRRLEDETLKEYQLQTRDGIVDDPAALTAAIVTAILALSVGTDRVQARKDVYGVFGTSRRHEYETPDQYPYAEPYAVYSNAGETETICDPCFVLDGRELRADDLIIYAVPYVGCDGGNLCKCLHLYTYRGPR